MKRMALVVMLCVFFGADVMAQCPTNLTAQTDRDRVWAKYTSVVVWVAPELGHALPYMQMAADNWSNSSLASMMGVTIRFTNDRSVANVDVVAQMPPNGAVGGFALDSTPGMGVTGGRIDINPGQTNPLAIGQTFAHELGHPFGLKDCEFCPAGASVMNRGTLNDTSRGLLGPSDCDETVSRAQWEPTFSDDPSGDPCIEYCRLGITDGDASGCYCGSDTPPKDETCEYCSPVVIDLDGDGIDLTAAADGVDFALQPGAPSRLAWTLAGDDDAWLALDRDCNGVIDDGAELFGNYTSQPATVTPNGYDALAVFDRPDAGGNGDNRIDDGDAVFGRLRIWTDLDHDGRSTPDELSGLADAGVESIDLAYRTSGRRDRHGNYFRYRAKVTNDGRERWSYDVFLATIP